MAGGEEDPPASAPLLPAGSAGQDHVVDPLEQALATSDADDRAAAAALPDDYSLVVTYDDSVYVVVLPTYATLRDLKRKLQSETGECVIPTAKVPRFPSQLRTQQGSDAAAASTGAALVGRSQTRRRCRRSSGGHARALWLARHRPSF